MKKKLKFGGMRERERERERERRKNGEEERREEAYEFQVYNLILFFPR